LSRSSGFGASWGDGTPQADRKISTPNQIPGTVLERTDGGVNSEIAVDIGGGKTLVSIISR
jgi:molybdate transport system regulatory protein